MIHLWHHWFPWGNIITVNGMTRYRFRTCGCGKVERKEVR